MVWAWYLLVWLLSAPALADRVEGKTLQVLRGDRLVVKDQKTKKRHYIELSGIMAPVEGQPFHDSSQASLHKLVRGKVLNIDWDKVAERCQNKPDTCPKIGRVLSANQDLNLEQVKRGMAWHDVRHMDEQTTPDRTLYGEAEAEARRNRRGLWRMKKPIAPWLFRKSN